MSDGSQEDGLNEEDLEALGIQSEDFAESDAPPGMDSRHNTYSIQ